MAALTWENPVFQAYGIAAALAILKLMGQAWVTVVFMLKEGGGFVSPEDAKNQPGNRHPDPSQLEPNPRVERSRRMQRNDLENIPGFLFAGLLFVMCAPPPWLAYILFFGFMISRALHTWAYATAQWHNVRAAFFSFGAAAVIVMAVYVLVTALTL